MNQLEFDDKWQKAIRDRLLAPFYREYALQGQVVFLDGNSPIARLLQRFAHADTLINKQASGDLLPIEEKFRRWPRNKQGRAARYHYDDFFLETMSCTIPGHEAAGWMATSQAAILLYCQVDLDENGMVCAPLPFERLREWFTVRESMFEVKRIENIIDGRALWTEGRLVPRGMLCRDLKVDRFVIRGGGVVEDFFGKPIDWISS